MMATYTERAKALRPYIIKASASLSDADALNAKGLYARWAAGMVVEPGDRLVHAVDGVDRLFRVNEGQGHTTQVGWEPDITRVWRKAPSFSYGDISHYLLLH